MWQGQRFSTYPKAPIPSVESVISALEDVDRQGYEETILQRMSENPRPSMQSARTASVALSFAKPSATAKASDALAVEPPTSNDPTSNGHADEETPEEATPEATVEATVSPFSIEVVHKPPGPTLLPDRLRAATGRLCQTGCDLVHLALCAITAVLFALLFALYDNGAQVHQSTRMWFFSVVVAPFGCYIRWQLGRLNFRVGVVVLCVSTLTALPIALVNCMKPCIVAAHTQCTHNASNNRRSRARAC